MLIDDEQMLAFRISAPDDRIDFIVAQGTVRRRRHHAVDRVVVELFQARDGVDAMDGVECNIVDLGLPNRWFFPFHSDAKKSKLLAVRPTCVR